MELCQSIRGRFNGISAWFMRCRTNILLIIGCLVFGFIVGGLPLETLVPATVVVSGFALAAFVVVLVIPERFFRVFNIFVVAFSLRIIVALLLYIFSSAQGTEYTVPPAGTPIQDLTHNGGAMVDRKYGFFLGKDDWGHSENAIFIAQYWKVDQFLTKEQFELIRIPAGGSLDGYAFWPAWIYYHVGYSPLTVFFINSLLGALFVLLVYFVSCQIVSESVSYMAAWLCTFWPSYVLWSTQNLKDMGIAFFIFLFLWGFIRFVRALRPWHLLFMIIGLAVIAYMRLFVIVSFLMAIGLAVLFAYPLRYYQKLQRTIIFGSLGGLVMLATVLAGLQERIMQQYLNISVPFLYLVDNMRRGLSTGNLAFLPDFSIDSYPKLMMYLPLGIAASLFGPFIWMISSMSQVIALPETLFYYMLIPLAWRGVRAIWKKGAFSGVFLLMFFCTVILMMALFEGNIGTMYRHRSMVMPIFLICAAYGWELKKARVSGNQGIRGSGKT